MGGYDGPVPPVHDPLQDEKCPQDSSHLLDSHAPGGAWYGRGHNGQPSPWPNGTPVRIQTSHSFVEGAVPVETVNHPAHYNQYKGLEVIDLVEQMNFNRGNAVKYITRAGFKSPEKELEDLKKARWYIDREISRLEST